MRGFAHAGLASLSQTALETGQSMGLKTLLLTVAGLIAMAAIAVLNRVAFDDKLIDALSFAQIRLSSAALVLLPFLIHRRMGAWRSWWWNWRPALALFISAIASSLAFALIDAGTGALIMFAMVQMTMIGAGMFRGERPNGMEWAGLVVAFAGLVYFLSPGLSAPPIFGALLMALAGIAWGLYSVYGRSETDPTGAHALNALLTLPLVALMLAAPPLERHIEAAGAGVAVLAGAAASGLGIMLWYAAVRRLTPVLGALVQLSVPLLAEAGGVLLLGEPFTPRLLHATALILGGIALGIIAHALA